MTPQEIFNKAYLGLVAQGKPARDPVTNSCHYRTADGLSCGVGMLIDDDLANLFESNPTGKGTPISSCLRIHKDKTPAWMNQNLDFLEKLQDLHDQNHSKDWVARFKDDMVGLADEWNLIIPLVT